MNAHVLDSLIHAHLPAAARGDQAAYGRIVSACQNSVTAIALAIVRDVHASEDIAQEAFLNAWQNLRKLKNTSSFLPWLRQITRNLARDHLRTRHRLATASEEADAAIEAAADPLPPPCEQLIDAERQAAAADLIAALPDDSREVLLLYYREGQSSQQVALLLGLSDAAVRKRLSRARASVRDDLLARFGAFARDTAPSVAFTTLVVGTLGTVSPPAAAAAVIAAGSAGAGLGKLGSGMGASALSGGVAGGSLGVLAELEAHAGGLLGGLAGGTLGALLGGYFLMRLAGNEAERQALGRFVRLNTATAAVFCLTLLSVALLSSGWTWVLLTTLAGLAVLNYQYLVPLQRVLLPYRERQRARRGGVPWAFELTYGRTGVVISNAVALGAIVYAMVDSGRF